MLVRVAYNATVKAQYPGGTVLDEREFDTTQLWNNNVYLGYAVLLATDLHKECVLDFGPGETLLAVRLGHDLKTIWHPVDNAEQATAALGVQAPADREGRRDALYRLVESRFPDRIVLPFGKQVV